MGAPGVCVWGGGRFGVEVEKVDITSRSFFFAAEAAPSSW